MIGPDLCRTGTQIRAKIELAARNRGILLKMK